MLPYNKKLVTTARTLRKNMTPEEKHLWYDFLKRLPVTVKRQHNIENYIVDFYIAEKKLVIELDGIQHTMPYQENKDELRETDLKKWGITIVRYNNRDIWKNFSGVTDDILTRLGLEYSDLKPIK